MRLVILMFFMMMPFPVLGANPEETPPRGTLKKIVGISLTVIGGAAVVVTANFTVTPKKETYLIYGVGAASIFAGVLVIKSGNADGRRYREWQQRKVSQHGTGIQILEKGPALAYEYKF